MGDLFKNIITMLESNEVKVIYKNMPCSCTGHVMTYDGYTVILLNSNLTYEENLKVFLHEISHLDHLNTSKDTKECEYEAESIEHNPNALEEIKKLKRLDYFYKHN